MGSTIVNLSLWCLFEAVKSVFSKDFERMGAKWRRECSPKVEWNLCLVWKQRERSGPLCPQPREIRVSSVDRWSHTSKAISSWLCLTAGFTTCSCWAWQSKETPAVHRDGSWKELSKLQEILSSSFVTSINIFSDKHTGSACEFVNLIQIRTLGVLKDIQRMHFLAT